MNNNFASGSKRHYYGKGDVIVYRLRRTGGSDTRKAVFGANVMMLIYGDAFWRTYTDGDNTGLIATDSMKNFIQREALNFPGDDQEGFCRFIAARFLDKYSQVEGAQVSSCAIPYAGTAAGTPAYAPAGPERAWARVEIGRNGLVEVVSGLRGFRLLRLGGSRFEGFVRDEYTTLPDLKDRPLHMWLDLEWSYTTTEAGFSNGATAAQVRSIVHDVFASFASGSIQQLIYMTGTKILDRIPEVKEVRLEANNRTWDTIAEQDELGVYTDARPPFGCLGLTLGR